MPLLLAAVGGVMVLVGGLWTAQGLGWVDGSAMSGEETWAIVGPLVAGLGVALIIVGAQRRGGQDPH
jgi:drug/metabolite transporter superfamily protein YnfA